MNFTCSKVWIEKREFPPFLMAGSPENEGPFGRDSGFGGSHDFQAGSAVSFQGKWDPMVSLYMTITVPKRWLNTGLI